MTFLLNSSSCTLDYNADSIDVRLNDRIAKTYRILYKIISFTFTLKNIKTSPKKLQEVAKNKNSSPIMKQVVGNKKKTSPIKRQVVEKNKTSFPIKQRIVSKKEIKSPKKRRVVDKKKNLFFILAGSAIVLIALVNLFNLLNNDEYKPVQPGDSGALPIFIPDKNQADGSTNGEYPKYIPDRLIIPAIYLDAPVQAIYAKIIEVDGEEYSQYVAPGIFAAGWHINSAKLGQIGNTVLSGHHNAFGEVFADLEKLEAGNQIRLMSGEKVFEYIITNKMILPEKDEPLDVRLDNARWIMPSDDERITLVTCWPHNSNTHRLIIVAVPYMGPS